jgi:hypothetical protein
VDLRDFGWGYVEWIQLAKDRDFWRALVNTVMNLLILAKQRVRTFRNGGRCVKTKSLTLEKTGQKYIYGTT